MVEVLTGEVVGIVSVFETFVLNVDLDVDNEVVVFAACVTAINDVVTDDVFSDDVVDEVIANSAVINLEAGVDLDAMEVSSVVTASPKNS